MLFKGLLTSLESLNLLFVAAKSRQTEAENGLQDLLGLDFKSIDKPLINLE